MYLPGYSLFLLSRLPAGWNAEIMRKQPSWTTGDPGNEEAPGIDTETYLPVSPSMKAAGSDVSRQSTALKPLSWREPPCSSSQPSQGGPYPVTDHCGSIKAWPFWSNSRQLWGICHSYCWAWITAWPPLLTPAPPHTNQTGLCVLLPKGAGLFAHIVSERNSFLSFWFLFKTHYLNEPCPLYPTRLSSHQHSWSLSSCYVSFFCMLIIL